MLLTERVSTKVSTSGFELSLCTNRLPINPCPPVTKTFIRQIYQDNALRFLESERSNHWRTELDIIKGEIEGVLLMKMNKFEDDRGFFARNFCKETIINSSGFGEVSQANLSFNKLKGTIRGLHFQYNGCEESKTVTVLHGSLYYVILDLRKDSPSYLQQESFVLKALESVVQVPKGCAPGFQTLEDDVLLHYYVSNPFSKANESGIRYNDSYFDFGWPLPITTVSERDSNFPDFSKENFVGLSRK